MIAYTMWIGAALVILLATAVVSQQFSRRWREHRRMLARSNFFLRREWLEAEFVKLAGLRGIPRGLRWVDCDFDDDVQFARDRTSGQLRALVAVSIRFEAIEGGEMEDVEAAGNLRAATAIFFFDRNRWTTTGRALFNLNPAEAIKHYQHELETVD